MGNFATSRVIDEGTVKFHSHNGCITTLQGAHLPHHVPESRYNLISLGALHGEGFNFSSEGDLIEVFKDAQVKFQAVSAKFTCCEIQKLQLVDCSYSRLHDRRL